MLNLLKNTLWKTIIAGLVVSTAGNSIAQAQSGPGCNEDAMLIFDGSGSMAEVGFNGLDLPRIMSARQAMKRSIPNITPFRRLGLMVYGASKDGELGCKNITLHFPPIPEASNRVLNTLERLSPSGATPLTQSVFQAARVLDYENKPGVVVLVTDGQENCGGLPCQLASEFAATAFQLTVHVIGFQVRGDFFSWQNQYSGTSQYSNGNTVARCLADQTGGHYVSTETVDELTAALQKTLGCAVVGQTNGFSDRTRHPS
ncbi:MAG: VWA domain-containing protein [Pseudomonadota bacterium]